MRLAAFRTLCYNTGNRPSYNLGGGKHHQSANQRIHAAAFARNPVAPSCGRRVWLCIDRMWKKRTGRGECGIFLQLLTRWMGGPLSLVAFKARHWG